jgi:hypothetical protein
VGVDQPDDFLVLELVQSQLFLLLLENQLLPFKLVLQVLPLSLQSSDLLVPLFLNFRPLVFELLDLFLELSNGLLADLLAVGLFFLQFILNLPHLLLLDDILLMQFADLLLFIVDGFDLLFGLLRELL